MRRFALSLCSSGLSVIGLSGAGCNSQDCNEVYSSSCGVVSPQVDILEPIGGASLSGTVTVRARVSSSSPLKRVQGHVGDTLLFDEASASLVEFSFETRRYARTDHIIRVTATDVNDLFGADHMSAFFADGIPLPDAGVVDPPDTGPNPSPNLAPTAYAGPDVAVAPGATVALDGRASADPERAPLTYAWSLLEAPPTSTASITNATSARANIVVDQRGVYEVQLVVSDGELDSAPDALRIGAGVSANAPVANAGADRTVLEGSVVRLDASLSEDPDGDALSYSWRIASRPPGATAALSTTDGAETDLTPDDDGRWTLELTVDDGFWRDTDTVTLTVEPDPVAGGDSIFDPGRVYVIGTLQPASGGFDLFCDFREPDRPKAGFENKRGFGWINPANGRYTYFQGFVDAYTIREFTADPLPPNPQLPVGYDYPSNPLPNDPVLPTPACGPDGPTGFRLQAGTGTLYYRCEQNVNPTWYRGNVQIDTCDNDTYDALLAIDEDGATLCRYSIMDANGVETEFPPGPPRFEEAVRARPGGGFWATEDNRATVGAFQRLAVDTDGTVTVDATYPAIPAGYSIVNASVDGWIKLDAEGNMYRWLYDSALLNADVIMRFDADTQTTQAIYDESTNPVCKLHAFSMVTGP